MDETYIGGKRKNKAAKVRKAGERARDCLGPLADKTAVVSLMQRGGKVYSRHVERVTAENLTDVIN
jgi:hypothetical protein